MTLYSIDPRDPLVVRDGRPNDGRSQSTTLRFPPPSVFAGVVRSAYGRRSEKFDSTLIPDLLSKVTLRGPLLGDTSQDERGLYVPAPGDALAVRGLDGTLRVRALRPLPLPEHARASSGEAKIVGLPPGEVDKGKPERGVPAFWRWSTFERWLATPGSRSGEEAEALLAGGLVGLATETRMHVALGDTFTAEEGKLFATVGLRGSAEVYGARTRRGEPRHRTICFEVGVDVDPEARFPGTPEGLRPLAGERRLTRWAAGTRPWPETPRWLSEHVATAHPLVRLVLLTPAYVETSDRPSFLSSNGGVEIVAAQVGRPETLSGWDLAKRRPKKTRRFAPAGSVYWLRLGADRAANQRWVEERWMRNVGDDEQLRRDGFGLAVFGIGLEAGR